jgi:hypothetical protein
MKKVTTTQRVLVCQPVTYRIPYNINLLHSVSLWRAVSVDCSYITEIYMQGSDKWWLHFLYVVHEGACKFNSFQAGSC